MELSRDDQKIIEQALKFAAANTTDYTEIGQYAKVWRKLQIVNGSSLPEEDGFRYDYDD